MILSSAVGVIKQLDCLQLCSPAGPGVAWSRAQCLAAEAEGPNTLGKHRRINQQLSTSSYMSLDLKIYRQASDVQCAYCILFPKWVCISLQNTEDPHLTVTLSIYSSHQPSQAQVELMWGQKLVMITTGQLGTTQHSVTKHGDKAVLVVS